MLHSMTIRLMHVDRLIALYLYYGVSCQSGVIWSHWGQKVIFSKNATCTELLVLTLCNKVYLCYVSHFYMHELETIVFCHSGSNSGHFRRQTTPSAMANSCLVLLLSSFFWQHVFFTYFPTSDFDQTWSQ